MKNYDRKLKQIQLQHTIQNALFKDNGVSCHFDYHVNLMSGEETIKLNVLTYNPRHDEYMLFHSVKGSSSIECLERMVEYINTKRAKSRQKSFTIRWKRKGESQEHLSYFSAASEEDALNKFLHERDAEAFEFKVTENPVS
jgi:hypothetical protein